MLYSVLHEIVVTTIFSGRFMKELGTGALRYDWLAAVAVAVVVVVVDQSFG